MISIILAILNTLLGLYLILNLTSNTPGFVFVLFITIVINAIGLSGLILWFWKTFSSSKNEWVDRALKSWQSFALGINLLLIIGIGFRTYVLQPFLVDGNSMEPNYHNNEFIMVDRITYEFKDPSRGDVIIFKYPKDPSQDYIKRIIGLPGDTVVIDGGKVYTNGQLLTEDYLEIGEVTQTGDKNQIFTKTVGQNEYFVLGDNRTHSSDSREWGFVPIENIIGRSWIIVYPFNYFKVIKNPFTMVNNLSINK